MNDVTVILSTFNRKHNLPDCLASLANQRDVEDLSWELLVIDNNSTDGTNRLVAELAEEYSTISVRRVLEKRQGLSYARNRGIVEANSRYLVFIDDDIRATREWLASVYAAFEETKADAVGGPIHLEKSIQLPRWVTDDMRGFLGYQDHGSELFQMNGLKRYPFGGNMGFKALVFDKIGLFDTRMGLKGEGKRRSELFKGAETDLLRRLALAGGRIFYEPRALVYHKVRPSQLKKRYFRTIHFNQGYHEAMFDADKYDRTVVGVPLFLYNQAVKSIYWYLQLVLTRGPNFAFRQQMTAGYFIGRILGYTRANRLRSSEIKI
jgi:glycosyltransferase involved in cell wall biosynthesis